MKKAELRNWVKHNLSGMWTTELLAKIDQLEIDPPTLEPTLLPFQYPVPNGHKVVTRSGKIPTEFGKFETATNESFVIYGVIDGCIESWNMQGDYHSQSRDAYDLFLLPPEHETVTIWLNYYGDGYEVYDTEKACDNAATPDRIGPAIKITFQKPIINKP